jgi:hypothetical protein
MATRITRKFDGRTYQLAVIGVNKKAAQKESDKLHKTWGTLARIVRRTDGKYNVYSRHI